MVAITSRKNPAVKFARKLHMQKYRKQENLFLMEGFRALREVIKINYPLYALYYSPGIKEQKDQISVEILSTRAEHVYFVSDEIMEYISPSQSPQKIMAVLPIPTWKKENLLNSSYSVGLYQIRDPGNLGTIIRSAKAFMCGGISLIGKCVDPFNPKVVRASAGYIISVPVVKWDSFSSFASYFNGKANLLYVSQKGKRDVGDVELNKGDVLIFGGEAEGLEQVEIDWDRSYRIKMERDVESLNLAVSVSIVMEKVYEKVLHLA